MPRKLALAFIWLSKAKNLYTLDAVEECLQMVQYAIAKVVSTTDGQWTSVCEESKEAYLAIKDEGGRSS